ncbi:SulP family inorganic anion transporter [Pseudobacteroides cellulosolvens]|uniref:Sulfate transporter n=1 Tax=Pseudobacteroides cellulosolvens ATCC 35603 = DSM 2933 TaxID=398512 RepID=A0A0L6JIK0_9FIRM|nr:SulP family inorganic anion transporter [Pseudobacteroides cellulosolvens]KNY25523.1 sulfate transporter [Pseudobacteroides cellulosolvens ATCC 35603 = DSM 2933]
MRLKSIKKSWFGNVRGDILSGITVALALIPEAISFAIICGVDPMVGLYASFCIAVTISIFGGRPAMISAATGAMALVMVTLVKNHGVEYMFAATILTGIIQFILGKLKFGKLIDFVPHPVVLGFVNALAILIFMAQIPHFKGESWIMYALVAVTLGIVYLFPKITKKVPSPLVAIIMVTIITVYLRFDIRTVGDMGNITRALPVFHIPNIPFSLETITIIFPYAVTLSLVGILESLLTATILDEMTDSKSNNSKEVEGQGISNVVAGFFGGMAGCAMIGQSVINVKSGGRARLSTFVAGVFLLFLIICLGDVVKVIPMAALVGVMIMVSISTFEWKSITEIRKMPVSCAIGMITTMVVVVMTHNLATGVLAGIAISAIMFAWKITEVRTKVHTVNYDGNKYKIYRVHGQIFFASTSKFIESFNYSEDPNEVIIDFKNSHIWDHSAATAISKIKQKYSSLNKQVSFVGLNKESNSVLVRADESILEY